MPPRLDYTEIEINLRLNIITLNVKNGLKLRVLCNDGVFSVLYFWRNKGAVLLKTIFSYFLIQKK